ATLSTTVRQFTLPNNKPALLSDTIGFIRNLPHHLIASFRTTLAEANESDVLLQVIDISNQNFRVMINTVNETLEEIGIKDKPMIYVFNKIDKLDSLDMLHQLQSEYPQSVFISAERGINITALLERMQNEYEKYNLTFSLFIPYSAGADVNKLYENAEILERIDDNDGTRLLIKVESRNKDRLMPIIEKYSIDMDK
ncbi:MAG TPA: 50S ribosome-binding GTPase, partial [Bacteroidota bacterium]|nr:50S ribosome-binding GTPase [Bacteroidota bacterium]